MAIKIFTTPTCSKCMLLKQALADLNPEIIDCFVTPELAEGIMSVPTVVINNDITLINPTAKEVREAIK